MQNRLMVNCTVKPVILKRLLREVPCVIAALSDPFSI